MNRTEIFIGILVFLSLTVLAIMVTGQSGLNSASLTDEFIRDHPGQSVIPYPLKAGTSIKILPFDFIIPAVPSNNLSLEACRDEFESASFVLTSQQDLSGISIIVPDLHDVRGNSIPADAINVRLVKVWYQADESDIYINKPGSRFLTPELLLKDDNLVKADYVNRTNYLKVTQNGSPQYIDISSPGGTIPNTAILSDAVSLQPFSLSAHENKQVWITVHIPDNTPSGVYYGDISITIPSKSPLLMHFSVTVLPFDLEPPPLEYALYYRGVIPPTPKKGINSEWKTPDQYASEMKNMKEHGVAYPTMISGNAKMAATELSLRDQIGLPTDHIYLLGVGTGNATTEKDLALLQNQVVKWKNIVAQYGYREVYFYGIDEATGDVLQSEQAAWQTVKENGGNVYVAVQDNPDAVVSAGDLLDVAVFAGPLNAVQATEWHLKGQKIFSYANPQVGVENPELYRKNYGFALWNAGYDGAMNYAYQHGYGQIWNDFDNRRNRDHVFAYPTSDGVIDTLQWEGWREGVDDTRYLATLIAIDGNDASARALVSESLSRGEDMATIRKKVIDRILVSPTHSPL
jgi:hypothetical protein